MKIYIDTRDYLNYINHFLNILKQNKNYITQLDTAIGDGDHWVNMNKGFQRVVDNTDSLKNQNFSDMLRNIGVHIMTTVGGASGVLYGSAYLEAAKVVKGQTKIDMPQLLEVYKAMLSGIERRGQSKPGFKTMVDTLYIAINYFEKALQERQTDHNALLQLKTGARVGMESTRNMIAVKGRAYYQHDKGIGHLDPGAVTMSYQIEALADYLIATKNKKLTQRLYN